MGKVLYSENSRFIDGSSRYQRYYNMIDSKYFKSRRDLLLFQSINTIYLAYHHTKFDSDWQWAWEIANNNLPQYGFEEFHKYLDTIYCYVDTKLPVVYEYNNIVAASVENLMNLVMKHLIRTEGMDERMYLGLTPM